MKNHYRKFNRKNPSLGDLVAAVGSVAKNDREAVAVLADLFESGRVRVRAGRRLKRVRLTRSSP